MSEPREGQVYTKLVVLPVISGVHHNSAVYGGGEGDGRYRCCLLQEHLNDVLRNGLKRLINAMDKRNTNTARKIRRINPGPQLIPVASLTGLAVSSRRPYREPITLSSALSPPFKGGLTGVDAKVSPRWHLRRAWIAGQRRSDSCQTRGRQVGSTSKPWLRWRLLMRCPRAELSRSLTGPYDHSY